MSFPWWRFLFSWCRHLKEVRWTIPLKQPLFSLYAEDDLEGPSSCLKASLGYISGNKSPPHGYQHLLREMIGMCKYLLQNNIFLGLWTQILEVEAPFNADFEESLKQGKYSPMSCKGKESPLTPLLSTFWADMTLKMGYLSDLSTVLITFTFYYCTKSPAQGLYKQV